MKRIILAALLLGCVVIAFARPAFTGNAVHDNMLTILITRLLAGIYFLIVIKSGGPDVFSAKPAGEFGKSLLFSIPAFVIAVNNMPVISFIVGNCRVSDSAFWVAVFAAECLAVGLFEEAVFRGLLLPHFLKRCRTRIHIFVCVAVTSCVFGLYHLFNLFEGASFGDVLRQVGYSALIGAMCAVVMLITGNLTVPILIHGIYNFCGMLFETLGEGFWWDTPTIVITVVLSVLTVVFYAVVFVKMPSFRLYEQVKVHASSGTADGGNAGEAVNCAGSLEAVNGAGSLEAVNGAGTLEAVDRGGAERAHEAADAVSAVNTANAPEAPDSSSVPDAADAANKE